MVAGIQADFDGLLFCLELGSGYFNRGTDDFMEIHGFSGDFQLVVGRDFSIGYLDHDAKAVRLYIEESFTFRLLSPQAAVPLTQ